MGTANPSGLLGKERQLADLPSGIWNVSETHLSGVNQLATFRRVQRVGADEDADGQVFLDKLCLSASGLHMLVPGLVR